MCFYIRNREGGALGVPAVLTLSFIVFLASVLPIYTYRSFFLVVSREVRGFKLSLFRSSALSYSKRLVLLDSYIAIRDV